MRAVRRKIVCGLAVLLSVLFVVSGNAAVGGGIGKVVLSVNSSDDNATIKALSQTATQSEDTEVYAHGVTVDDSGNFVFKFNGVTYKNEYERLLAEDGFIYGVDWNFFAGYSGGMTSVGDNELSGFPSQLSGRQNYIKRSLYNMKALGFTAINVWITICDGGIVHDHSTGYAIGLNDSFKENLVLLLNMCREAEMDIVPTLLTHGEPVPFQNSAKGMTNDELQLFYQSYYYNEEARESYLNNVVHPICDILKGYQDIIPIMGMTIENTTYSVNDPELGFLYGKNGSTTWSIMAELINDLHDVSKQYMPNVPTSVEDVSWEINGYRINDLKVDLIGRNNYDADGDAPDQADSFVVRPMYYGEYNVAHTVDVMDEHPSDYWTNARVALLENAVKNGYIGAFYFNWMNDEGGSFDFFSGRSADIYDDLQPFAVPLAYKIKELKNAHNGITTTVDTPVMLYNNQSSTHYWIGGRGVSSYTLEYSVDGGEWEVLSDNIDPYESQCNNGLLTYTGPEMQAGKTYRYRIIAQLEDGQTAVSEASNETSLFIPKEMFVDSQGNYAGGFEEGGITGTKAEGNSNGWYENGWHTYGEFLKDSSIAYEGEYCMHVNPINGIGSKTEYAAQTTYNLVLEPNTMYDFSFMGKGSANDDSAWTSIVVKDYENSTLSWSDFKIADEWTASNTVRFIAPADGKVMVVLMSTTSSDMDFYIDNLSIMETR